MEQKQADYYATPGWSQSSAPHSLPMAQGQYPAQDHYSSQPSDSGPLTAPVQQSMYTGSTDPSHGDASQAGGRQSYAGPDVAMSPTIGGLHELPDANAFSAAQNIHPSAHELGTDGRRD